MSSFPVWKSHEKTRDKGGFYWLLHHLQWLFPLPSMTWEWAVDMQLLSCGPAYKASQYHSLSEINQMACLTYTDVIFRTFPEPRLLHFQDIFFNYKKTITNGHPEFFSWNIFLLNAGAEFVLLFLLGLMVHFPTSEIVWKTTKVSDWALAVTTTGQQYFILLSFQE